MNQESSTKIKEFTGLISWQSSYKLVLDIYSLTKKYPQHELYGLTSQLRRASVSISSNIAEGFGRYSYKEKLRFYYLAHGSLTEVKNLLLISKGLSYSTAKDLIKILSQLTETHKLLRGLIKSTESRI